MNGEIIFFDADRGVGFITGRDGNRYVFDRADLVGAERVAKGAAVDFTVDGDRARAVQPLLQRGARTAVPPGAGGPVATSAGSVPAVGGGSGAVLAPDIVPEGEALGILGYYRRCVTSRYASFSGRAPRMEYWGFVLVSLIIAAALGVVGILLDSAISSSGRPVVTLIVLGIYGVAVIIPSIAVTVRRIHDIGLSGWFFLLNFIPSVGGLIVFVFTLIPSQRHPNKWGPVPAGVRI